MTECDETRSPHTVHQDRAALADAIAGEGVEVAARLIALNGLAAEGAARRGDMPLAFEKLRLVERALNEAREILCKARRIAQ